MAGWPIYRIGQHFRLPVFSLPECPPSLSSLVLLCFSCCCCVFCCRHTVAFSCEQLCLLYLLCSLVTVKFSTCCSFTFSTDQVTYSSPFSKMQDHFHGIFTDKVMAASPFQREVTGFTEETKVIHSFVWLVYGQYTGGTRNKRGERMCFFKYQIETIFFSKLSYELVVLLFH